MDFTQEDTQNFEKIAEDTLTQFEKIAEAAKKALSNAAPHGGDAFASVNTMTSSAVHNLGQISQANRESYQTLVKEPAIAHLGISLSALGRWVRAESKPSTNGSATKKPSLSLGDHDELIRLRKENEQLRMEREILKKAAVFFAKEAE
ncbi:hypothetical protein IVG45_17605 [Methylomonas sp. LL1]|uniref:hypothetical protein n=1 Tax=Methylomonas sp. LL1 TaxID=2785785 RepID=UPI0018C3F7E3|nr:hypothetical protein IVG45_17605 [Methylomonas sp. LL1]